MSMSTLLELAEAHGIEIDYACRIGSCGECEVKFAGKVREKSELYAGEFDFTGNCKEKGLAYACCSVALSDLEVEALVSVSKDVESDESLVIQEWRSDSQEAADVDG
jgi:ferredoxin